MRRFRRSTFILWAYITILSLTCLYIGLRASGAHISHPERVLSRWRGWHTQLEDRYVSTPLPFYPVLGPDDGELRSTPLLPSAIELDNPSRHALAEPTMRLSDAVFPELQSTDSWTNENNKALRDLFRCIEAGNCVKNQDKGKSELFYPVLS